MPKKKGGKVQGRAKQKVKAQNASAGGKPPWMKKFAKSFDDGADDNNLMFRGFAQRSGESTPRDSGLALRHHGISFVSAGSNTPAEKEDDVQEEEVVAALVEEDNDDGDDIEDSTMQNTIDHDVDDSTLEATMVTDTDVEIANGTQAMHIHEHSEAPITDLDGATDALPDAAPAAVSKPPTPPQEESLSFVIDTEGDPALSRPTKSKPQIPVRPASPTPSDSSEEVILFHGRNKPKVLDDPIVSSRESSSRRERSKAPVQDSSVQKHTPTTQAQPQKNDAHVTDELLAALLGGQSSAQPQVATEARGWAAKAPQWDKDAANAPEGFTPAPPGSWWKDKGRPRPDLGPSPAEQRALDATPPRASRVAFAAPEEDQGAEDTIASLQSEWNQTLREKKSAKKAQQSLDDEFEDVEDDGDSATQVAHRAAALNSGMKTSRRGKRGRKRSNKLLRDLQSDQTDEDEAAYNDYMENLKAQLEADEELDIGGIRSAEGGPSLVVDGRAIDDGEVLDQSTRQTNFDELDILGSDSDSDDEDIGQDIDDLDEDDDENASDFDSSDLEDELYYNEQEQWEDEEDLRQRRVDLMTDEQIARLLAKQESLGISGDDVVLEDGEFMEVDDLDGFGDLDDAKAGLADLAKSSFGQSQSKRSNKKRGGPNFPNASALADSVDQYGDAGFDIMDFDRPSLRPKRGRKSKMPPELEGLSDDDLKDEMLGAWSNDREKKRLKKAEREELRREGLLGAAGKKGKADLSQKYLQGMTIPQIHDELRVFLQDTTKTTRAFPPMDKSDRKSLHEIASVLNLKSKSVGTGKNRAPVLYKTNRTAEFSDATFKRVTTAANKGFLKNSAFKGKKPKGGALPKTQRAGKARGADIGSTGLKHGQVVGGGAKEIGRENFGHRLMEKMGWQKGTALGAAGSSGLLTPVEQVMRTGRSGLG